MTPILLDELPCNPYWWIIQEAASRHAKDHAIKAIRRTTKEAASRTRYAQQVSEQAHGLATVPSTRYIAKDIKILS